MSTLPIEITVDRLEYSCTVQKAFPEERDGEIESGVQRHDGEMVVPPRLVGEGGRG
jgi:hypothetical protein